MTVLELAETVIRVTSSESEIVFEALPTDDPAGAAAGITRWICRPSSPVEGQLDPQPTELAGALARSLGEVPTG